MKKINVIMLPLFLLAMLGLIFWGGCSENPADTGQDQGSTGLRIEDIVVEPMVPQIGDTVMLTAVVTTGSYADVDYPSFSWQVDGGTLLTSNDGSQVLWASPDTSRIYTFTVTATNSQSSVTASKKAMVMEAPISLVSRGAGTMIPAGGDSIYYLQSTFAPENSSFEGFNIFLYANGTSNPATNSQFPGVEYVFSKDLSFAAHQYVDDTTPYTSLPVHIIIDDLISGVQEKITTDSAAWNNARRWRHEYPYISPTDPLIVFQGFHPDIVLPDQGAIDTFNIYIYDKNSRVMTQATRKYMNVFPSFSSDGSFMTFISDRDTTFSLEVFGYPVINGVVDTSTSSLVQLSHIGSWIPASIPPEKPFFVWNPNPAYPYMAIIDGVGNLRLIGTDGTYDMVQGIVDEITGMAWAPDGTKLAVIAGSSIYMVGLDRSSQLIESYPNPDAVEDVAWSNDGRYLMYNLERVGRVWMELIDLSGTLNLNKPLKITNALDAVNIADYRSIADISPRWGSISSVYYLTFDTNTPGIIALDLSGITR